MFFQKRGKFFPLPDRPLILGSFPRFFSPFRACLLFVVCFRSSTDLLPALGFRLVLSLLALPPLLRLPLFVVCFRSSADLLPCFALARSFPAASPLCSAFCALPDSPLPEFSLYRFPFPPAPFRLSGSGLALSYALSLPADKRKPGQIACPGLSPFMKTV